MGLSLGACVQGVVPPFEVVVCPNSLHEHAPGGWWEYLAFNPIISDILDKLLQRVSCGSSLKAVKSCFDLLCWQER